MNFPPVVLDYLPLEAPDLLGVNDLSDDLRVRLFRRSAEWGQQVEGMSCDPCWRGLHLWKGDGWGLVLRQSGAGQARSAGPHAGFSSPNGNLMGIGGGSRPLKKEGE